MSGNASLDLNGRVSSGFDRKGRVQREVIEVEEAVIVGGGQYATCCNFGSPHGLV
jgi:hypothetical protein